MDFSYKRNCPDCSQEISYKSVYSFRTAEINSTKCTSCAAQRRYNDGEKLSCCKCKKIKPLEDFSSNGNNGHKKSWCKDCHNKRVQEKRKENPIKQMVQQAHRRATRFNLEFDLDENKLSIPKKCPYLGIALVTSTGSVGPNSPSLDRIDPTKGYTMDNVIVCSHRANTIKNNATPRELIQIAKNLNTIMRRKNASKKSDS
jgi:hypothetical protein